MNDEAAAVKAITETVTEGSGATPSTDRLVLLTNPAMRARRRPLAIVLLWAYEALVALVLAWPFASFVGGQYGAHPEGDAPLWRPGGLALADMILRAQGAGAALSAHATFTLGIGAVVGLIPLAVLVIAIAFSTPDRRRPPFRRVLDRAIGAFPAYFSLFLVLGFVELVLVALGLVAGGAVAGASHGLGDARAQQIGAGVAVLFGLLAATAGVTHDLARVAVIRFDVGAIRGLRLALTAMRHAAARALWSWGWRATVSWAPVAFGAIVAGRLGGRAGFALVALTLLHQIIALSRVALRASWMARALRLVDDAHRVSRR